MLQIEQLPRDACKVCASIRQDGMSVAGGSGVVVVCRYILSNIETKRGIKRGDRIWQIGFGSGFKCNSAVWRAMRRINEQHVAWVEPAEMEHDRRWLDEYEAVNVANARIGAPGDVKLA